jgi:hypothetical protein
MRRYSSGRRRVGAGNEGKGSDRVIEKVRLGIYPAPPDEAERKRYLDEERGGRVKRREGSQSRAGQRVWAFEFASGKILMMTNWAAVAVEDMHNALFENVINEESLLNSVNGLIFFHQRKKSVADYLVRLWVEGIQVPSIAQQ